MTTGLHEVHGLEGSDASSLLSVRFVWDWCMVKRLDTMVIEEYVM